MKKLLLESFCKRFHFYLFISIKFQQPYYIELLKKVILAIARSFNIALTLIQNNLRLVSHCAGLKSATCFVLFFFDHLFSINLLKIEYETELKKNLLHSGFSSGEASDETRRAADPRTLKLFMR